MTIEPQGTATLSDFTVDGGTAVGHRPSRLGFNIVLTAALLALLVFGLPLTLSAIFWPDFPTVPTTVAALVPVILTVLGSLAERIFPVAGPQKSFETWLIHMQLTIFWFFSFTIISIGTLVAANAAADAMGVELGIIQLHLDTGADWLMLVLYAWLVTIAGDFFYYWYHRLMHKSEFFWQLHKLHHMDPQLDATTWQRSNWPDTIVSSVLILLPFAIVFKFDSLNEWELGAIGGTTIAMMKFFLMSGHINLRVQAGWASKFWCTPQVHRIHHSYLPQHHDRNFAFAFPMWDVLFGTYYQPKRDEFPPTGVPGETEITSFWDAQLFTLREWKKFFRERREKKKQSAL